MGKSSGIGVLDKAVEVLRATSAAPTGLADLCATTGLPRATAHRLAVGLEVHGLLSRDAGGRWCQGPRLAVLAAGAPDPLVLACAGVLPRLRDRTEVRRRGCAQSVSDREAGVASVSAPVRDAAGEVIAAVSVSGPVDRIGRRPGARWAGDLIAAAAALTAALAARP